MAYEIKIVNVEPSEKCSVCVNVTIVVNDKITNLRTATNSKNGLYINKTSTHASNLYLQYIATNGKYASDKNISIIDAVDRPYHSYTTRNNMMFKLLDGMGGLSTPCSQFTVSVLSKEYDTFTQTLTELNNAINCKLPTILKEFDERQKQIDEEKLRNENKVFDICKNFHCDTDTEEEKETDVQELLKQDMQFNRDAIERLIGKLLLIDDSDVKSAFKDYIG